MRLFVAVWPPEEVVNALSALDRPARSGLRWTTPDQWHVTVRFLGSMVDAEEGKGALAHMEAVAAPSQVMASAGPAVTRLGPSILCLPVAGLETVAAAVVATTADIGERPPERPFRGHLTLARAKRGVELRPFTGTAFSATWPVNEVTLVASVTGADRARYQVVASYPIT